LSFWKINSYSDKIEKNNKKYNSSKEKYGIANNDKKIDKFLISIEQFLKVLGSSLI